MSDKSRIEWTDATWNPVTGCTKVSDGCKHCYAERTWARLSAPRAVPNRYTGRKFTDVQCHMDVLTQPLRWQKPRRIFVNSMSDLFHPSVSPQVIADVFGIMAACPQHTFQVLTKRPEIMRLTLRYRPFREAVEDCMALYTDAPLVWPLPNVWIGVSVEDQATADERIPLLLDTPAATRWVSCEPLLGPVDLRPYLDWSYAHADMSRPDLNWVVVGGESGPKARPMRPDWVRSLRDQCAAAEKPFLFKQWGEWFPLSIGQSGSKAGAWNGAAFMHGWGDIRNPENNMVRAGKRAFGGRLLDGVEHNRYPVVQP